MDSKFAITTLDPTKTTIKVKVGDYEYEMLLSKFILNILASNSLVLESDISATLQSIKDGSGNTSVLQISTDGVKSATILTVGDAGTASGTMTLIGSLAGFTVYDRSYAGVGTANSFSTYCLNGSYYIYNQVGGAGNNVLSIDATTRYGSFLYGTVFSSKTTTEINAILTPPTGLTFYNSTLSTLCFYDSTGWKKVSHSSMEE
jgi:hypothetical protein